MPQEFWKTQGICANDAYVHMMLTDQKIDIFFEDAYREDAKRLCSVCPVVETCLSAGLKRIPRSEYRESSFDVPVGIWGGQTQRERRKFLKNLDKQIAEFQERLHLQLPDASDPNAA